MDTGTSPAIKAFPIVAIGASAGGLDAISKLLENLAPDLGVAYVIIQHLSPSHQSILPEILERRTSMKVFQVTDGMQVHRDSVYVIPPNAYMSIMDHKLTLSPRVRTDGGYHSIDHFLMALAPIYQNNAIAVILSGTATDGTEGVRAIKAEGGITFAQDDSAKFHGMPDNAAESGYVDFVLPPEKIATELATLVKLPYTSLATLDEVAIQEQELRKIQVLLFKARNVDFSNYKQTTITRRILRRMALNRISVLEDYTKLLIERSSELDLLYKDILINVTSFFREPDLYEEFPKTIFPKLLVDKRPSEIIRIWVPACSSGEEVYSIAICLFEYLSSLAIVTPVQLFATDLSESAIEKARAGIYSKVAVEKIAPQRLERFFVRVDDQYQIIKPIREVCVFATHNLLKDPPFSRLDLISCQNALIYLQPDAQNRILQSFHYALNPTGFLLLGKSESIGKASELFTAADKNYKLFSKKVSTNLQFNFSSPRTMHIPHHATDEEKLSEARSADSVIDKEAEKILLSRYVPASVAVNKDLQVLRFYGSTLNYLHPSPGKASLHLLKMVRDELIFDVRTLIHQAKKEGIPCKKEGIELLDDHHRREISIEVIPIRSLSQNPHYLILFKEDGPRTDILPPDNGETEQKKDKRDYRTKLLEQELKAGRDQMKLITEEYELNREELQSANEEILSSNEELQSINEELETSKEEMQSSNEELTTINEELLTRNIELKEAVEFSDAIIQTMTEPLLVLTLDMRVLAANKAFYNTFRLAAADTEGNFFYEMGNGQWNIPKLRAQLDNILHKDISFENFELSHHFPGIGRKTFLFNAMRMNLDNRMGRRFLVAIQDITSQRALEAQKEEFIGIASHELKTPVTTIKGYAQIIKAHLGDDSENEVADLIKKLNGQADKLAQLIESLLDVTRIREGQLYLKLSIFSINDLINEIVEEIQPSTPIRIIRELMTSPQITADRQRIGQVITNILSNAIKYSHGAEKIIVRSVHDLVAAKGGPGITVSIQDFGRGISDGEQASIFERFFRVRDSGSTTIPGLGLGLYIAAQIIRHHNGSMFVSSKPGEGSTFSFTVPVSYH